MFRRGGTSPIGRRAFLKAAGAGFAASLAPPAAEALARSDAVFASAYRDRGGAFGIALLSEDGAIVHRYALPARGHDLVRRPGGTTLIAFARRPGTFAAAFDLARADEPRIIKAPEGRHFYGHGAFSPDGRLLYATENDFGAARGVVGVYDATGDHVRLGEFDTFGTGPHELALLPDGKTLAVANGGIETHPDYPRAKLNVPTMRPNLAFIDAESGSLIARHALPAHMRKLSIRHLAIGSGGDVWFACQNEGDIAEPMALIGRARMRTGACEPVDLPQAATLSLRGYVGSIAANAETGHIAIASPRGGVALEVDPDRGGIVRSTMLPDVCGIAPSGSGFAFSSGEGAFAARRHRLGFDNHIADIADARGQAPGFRAMR